MKKLAKSEKSRGKLAYIEFKNQRRYNELYATLDPNNLKP